MLDREVFLKQQLEKRNLQADSNTVYPDGSLVFAYIGKGTHVWIARDGDFYIGVSEDFHLDEYDKLAWNLLLAREIGKEWQRANQALKAE